MRILTGHSGISYMEFTSQYTIVMNYTLNYLVKMW